MTKPKNEPTAPPPPEPVDFMNKFRTLGFIEYNGGLKVHNSLLSVVLRD